MSTRCQIQVIQEDMGREEKRTLYHHCDGYPQRMLHVFKIAWDEAREYLDNQYPWVRPGDYWELGRAGKAASFLCRREPGQFEPEEGHELHEDIEYYYKLYVMNGGAVKWEVEMYEPLQRFQEFWNNPSIELMERTLERTEVGEAALLPLAQPQTEDTR